MLKQNLNVHQSLLLPHKPFLSAVGGNAAAHTEASFPAPHGTSTPAAGNRKAGKLLVLRGPCTVKAVLSGILKPTTVNVKAVITVLRTVGSALANLGLDRGVNDFADVLGKSLRIELVASELDSKGKRKATVIDYARKTGFDTSKVLYEADFVVPYDFGEIGALLVENEYTNEVFVKNIVLNGSYLENNSITIECDSWIQSKFGNLSGSSQRIFFNNKSFLPSQTPNGLQKYREEELKALRGDGKGERKVGERIYDYDVYNDLADPEKSDDLSRPVLGGAEHPYPRRCRTGRPKTKKDGATESRAINNYVPRDDEFSEVKQVTFQAKTLYSALHALVPALTSVFTDKNRGFSNFKEIDNLYDIGVLLPNVQDSAGLLGNMIPRLVTAVADAKDSVLQFEPPRLIEGDHFSWLRDSEFSRQTLAGLNPCCIKLVTEWPMKSALDPEVYGPPESSITTEIVEKEIGGIMTVEEALDKKRLFVLDYHDVYLPYVQRVRQLEGTTLYGSRTLFFLTDEGTLRPLAIELVRPPMDGKPQWKHVFVECWDASGVWMWRLAKAHVLAQDSGFHQLVSHWLRTHACVEPYIIATHRQLSAMHPIQRLLHPHFRYTMEINGLARSLLVNAGGIIEQTFSPLEYSIELSSAAYDLLWRFDQEGLPGDLISRGMAVEDPSEPHGLKLTIPDYPYANDGLLIWDAIKQWVTDYVTHYYPENSLVQLDFELQAWWTEIRTVGHADKKEGWPDLKTANDLIGILTTIIWISSGHHAAVNFGQYDFAGYFPNRPTIARLPMPNEDPKEEERQLFLERPEAFLLDSFPTQFQAVVVMTILDVLSTHSPDEEYIGSELLPFYEQDLIIKSAFEKFSGRLKEIVGIIDERNADTSLLNRVGAGLVTYELLKPYSGPGVTASGIPNSISI